MIVFNIKMSSQENIENFIRRNPELRLISSTSTHLFGEDKNGRKWKYDLDTLTLQGESICVDCEKWCGYLTENNHCQECVKWS